MTECAAKIVSAHQANVKKFFCKYSACGTILLARIQSVSQQAGKFSKFFAMAEPTLKNISRMLNVHLQSIRDGRVCAKNYFSNAGCSLKIVIRELRLR
jgi:hypothetical protein